MVLVSALLSTVCVAQADPVASLSVNFLVYKMELGLSILIKRNSVKGILRPYLEPCTCKFPFVSV